jgi:hypothetical protein
VVYESQKEGKTDLSVSMLNLSQSILLAHAIRHREGVYGIVRFPECNAPYVTVLQYFLHVLLKSIPSEIAKAKLNNSSDPR